MSIWTKYFIDIESTKTLVDWVNLVTHGLILKYPEKYTQNIQCRCQCMLDMRPYFKCNLHIAWKFRDGLQNF